MPDTVIVAVLSLIGTLAGSFGGTQLIKYRIEQLEKKVEKHNSVVERTYLLEEKVKVANHRIEDLERNIRFEQLRIQRLKEMKNYFQLMQRKERFQEVELHNMSYNIWHIGKHIQMDAPMQKTVEILADAMPFSYVAIRISIASILSCQEELEVCIGLGILEKNKELLGLEFPMPLEERSRRHVLQLVIETQDPFHLKRSEIQPLLDECEKRGIPLQRDLIGRIYISYQKKEQFVHGVGIGIEIANKN